MFKGIFLADLHCSKSRQEGCNEVLQKLIDTVKEQNVKPYVFICGDFWDAVITNSEVFAQYLTLMKQLIDITKVYIIYGTPTHDVEGSLECFKLLGAEVYAENSFVDCGEFELITLPEPRKSHYSHLVTEDTTISDVINADLKKFISSLPQKTKTRIAMVHNEIKGIAMDNGVPCSSPVSFTPAMLKALNADFIGCGHIHTKQEIFENCWYLGSVPQKTLGEKHEPAFMEVEIC